MGYKIVLIEDNELDINFFRFNLRESGNDVGIFTTASGIEEGIRAVKETNPDIIFLDLNLTDCDGIESYRRLKVADSQTPVVIITGNDDEKIALQALREGAQDYILKKHITPLLISRAIIYALERKKTENELLQSKAANEALLENTNDGIWSVDTEMCFVQMNRRFIKMMNILCGREPKSGEKVTDILPPQYTNWFESLFDKAMKGEQFENEQMLKFNNEEFILEFSVNPIRNSDESIEGISFFARDISHRKRAEIKIRKTEDAYKLLLETINDGVMFIDNDNIIRFANKKFIETTGFGEEELNGADFSSLLSPDSEGKPDNIVSKILTDEEPREIVFRNKQGTNVWFMVKGTPLMDENGIVGGTLLTHTEITERKKAEQEIKQKDQDYSNLLETMNEGLVYIDHQGVLKFANQKFETLTGFGITSLLNNKLPGQILPETLLGLLTDEHENQKEEVTRNFQYERQITRSAGDKIWCLISGTVLREDSGMISGLLITYSDISDRKKTEEKLQVAQRDLNTFIYRASHDLKGPLSSILGLLNILEKEQESTSNSPCVKMIKQSAEKLDRMLNEMLNIVRIKKEKIFPEVYDFRSELSSIVQGLRTTDAFYSVRRNFDIENRKQLRTDKKLLSLILHNLLDNAIKYHNPEADSFVTVKVTDYMHGVKICIEDNGLGFKDGTRENIFNMFNKGSYNSEGNGLGLYVVKNAVDRLGGYIDLKSDPGSNTVFTIFLPDLFSANQWVGDESDTKDQDIRHTSS